MTESSAMMTDSLCFPSVAVIIVNWNAEYYLRKCLSSLSTQTVEPMAIILVDNASQHPPADWITREYPRVKVIRLETNVGFAAANNLGAREARGCERLAFLNPDAFAHPRWLEALLEADRRFPRSAFGSKMFCAQHPDRIDGTGDVYHTSGLIWRKGHGRQAMPADPGITEIFSPCAAAALFPRDLFLEIGGFDEDFFCYCEDVDLGFRFRLRGYRCYYVPDAVVDHIGSATTGRRSDFSVYHGHRNLVWTFVKNMPWPLLCYYFPQHLALNLFSLAWFSLRGQAKTIFRAKRDALGGLFRVWHQRRQVHAIRKTGSWRLRKMMNSGLKLKQ